MQTDDDEIGIEPQGIIAVISEEIVKLPADVCAYGSVKTSLCRDGVLAINIGIIDPGWEGPISSVLLNFGKEKFPLCRGQAFLRLTFHRVSTPNEMELGPVMERAVYEAQVRSKFDKRLASSFMDFEKAAEKGSERFTKDLKDALFKYLPIAVLMLTILTFLLNFGVLSIANRAMPYDVVQLRAEALVEKATAGMRKENEDLKKRLEELEGRLGKQKKDTR
jgi:deoxycytidine triphosphate deaminase